MSNLLSSTLVVVADGGGARLLRNKGSGGAIQLIQERLIFPENLLDDGPAGSRPAEQTQQQTDEATFAKQLTRALNTMYLRGEFETLVLMADPQTLAQMRGLMHKSLENALLITLAKDHTSDPVERIAAAIERAMENA